MGLSESEIEARLALLRRRREALDREIADLVLYLELGRRLAGAGPGPASGDPIEPGTAPGLASASAPSLAPYPSRPGAASAAPRQVGPSRAGTASEPGRSGAASPIPPVIPFTEDAAGARRYGRALVEAACAAIAAAGRPLHAAEILAVLVGQGFTLPGRDPVAALNTRLWKRAGPDGVLRRVGEATYALAAPA